MNKQVARNILLFLSIATSLFCVVSFVLEKPTCINGIISREIHWMFGIYFKGYIFLINIFYCVIGIILFVIFIIKNKLKFFIKLLLLVPSILISIYLIYLMQSPEMRFPILLFAIGSFLFLFYYINQNYKLIIIIPLCILFPINILISLIDMWGLMGI